MTVNQRLMELGGWSLQFKDDAPESLGEDISYFDHIAVLPARMSVLDDNLLTSARFVGVVRKKERSENLKVAGQSMAFWLGDENGGGPVFDVTNKKTFDASGDDSLSEAVRALLPPSGAITEGVFTNPTGNPQFEGEFYWVSSREAIQYVCDTLGGEWRVNNDGTLDVGPDTDLFTVTTPTAAIIRKEGGDDPAVRILRGAMSTKEDVEDYTTKVLLLTEGYGTTIQEATSVAGSVPYTDIHGNTAEFTRMISEDNTSATNAQDRADAALNEFNENHRDISLDSEEYDVVGYFEPGDYVWVYDPAAGIVDTANEVTIRGETIYPLKLRVKGVRWPVEEGMAVYHRDGAGNWTDLTDYVDFDGGGASIEVGRGKRTLTRGAQTRPGSRQTPTDVDATVPKPPTALTLDSTSSYVDEEGNTRAQMLLSWTAPTQNTDNSTLQDLEFYRVRWKRSSETDYQYTAVDEDQTSIALFDLTPAENYDIGVRAVDRFANKSTWEDLLNQQAQADTIPPSTPAAPSSVAGNPQRIQVTHDLGVSTGGTFNLEDDLDHLEVHVGTASGFTPDDTTRVGEMVANKGMLALSISAIGDFPAAVTEGDTTRYVKVIAVDHAGNKSSASAAATVTAPLITETFIADLTVTDAKIQNVSAGKVTAATFQGGQFILDDTAGDTSVIKSNNYDGTLDVNGRLNLDGTVGFAIDGLGNIDANDGRFRGQLVDGAEVAGDLSVVAGGQVYVGEPTVDSGYMTFRRPDANSRGYIEWWVDGAADEFAEIFGNPGTTDVLSIGSRGDVEILGGDGAGGYERFILVDESQAQVQFDNDVEFNGFIVGFTDFAAAADFEAGLRISGDLGTGPGFGNNGGSQLLLSDTGPQIEFHDTNQTATDGSRWWLHVNSGNFYLLLDRNGDNSWEAPHPIQYDASTSLLTVKDDIHVASTTGSFISFDHEGNSQGRIVQQSNAFYFQADLDDVGGFLNQIVFRTGGVYFYAPDSSYIWRMSEPNNDSSYLYGREGNDYIEHDGVQEQWNLYLNDGIEFNLGQTGIIIPNMYNDTVSSGSELRVGTDGRVRRFTSSQRYKMNFRDASVPSEGLLDVPLRWWQDVEDVLDPDIQAPWHIGWTAEELDAHGLSWALHFDAENRPDGYHTERLLMALTQEVRKMRDRIIALEGA